MLARPRVLWAVPLTLLAAALVYTGWLAWQVQGDLRTAQSSADRLPVALRSGDTAVRDRAAVDLSSSSADAASRTSGPWWAALTHLPLVGDDAAGVRGLSVSLHTLSGQALPALITTVDRVDEVTTNGRIDVDAVRSLRQPVARAERAFASANAEVASLDSSGYTGALRPRFEKYVELVGRTTRALTSAHTAVQVLPTMVGADGPRDYLLIFQNNAEIRATGGMPGSWALLHAENGTLALTKQGTASDFPTLDKPVLPLSRAETAVYGEPLGTYFQDPGFTPDYPRAAELWRAHWNRTFPAVPIDGVISLDPVGLSYLLAGTGPVEVGAATLTSDNLVEELLDKPYVDLTPVAQDAFFARATRSIFKAATGDLASPLDFVQGVDRAASEGRLLVADFDPPIARRLSGTRVAGELSGDDGFTPHVDIGVNDATGSKMSYYLRYAADVKATSCRGGAQQLSGSMTLTQRISPARAAALPVSVTGGGNYGTEPGSQMVLVRLYGPFGGSIVHVRMDGRSLDRDIKVARLDGRPVTTLVVLLSNRKDVVVSWTMRSGDGGTGDIELGMTPGIGPGSTRSVVKTAC